MNLRETKFVSIDLETGGLDTKKDDILAVGIVPMIGTKILINEAYYSLVKPENFKIDTIKIHGLDPKSLEKAPKFNEIASEIYNRIRDRIIVGYAVEIDIAFLKRAFKKIGYNIDNKYIDIIEVEKVLCQKLGEPLLHEDLTLDAMMKRYKISGTYRHNALADAFFAAQIFQIQLVKLLKYGINTLEKLEEILKYSLKYSDKDRLIFM